jgi:diguanylate cyclase (GGDEF)-like protein
LNFRENKIPFGVLFCDIDHFKNINDTFGHKLGDKVLRMVAQTLRANIRDTDTMGRLGGEEFLVILQDVDAEALLSIAEKLLNLVRQSHLTLPNERTISATISIGGTLLQESDTVDTIVDRADKLMYESKSKGRNSVTIG